ncbi:hypothetical protein H4219_003745 [Mycoemilia scoparia]|uniref:Uncharacterized protein n=1 Tax=Mycoemilia scoparia TaxID=417184 RepID=A0A9W8DNV5_9FUNG|nr:hypothetical protein H4219_003745 [Mycoemilia scoparia]
MGLALVSPGCAVCCQVFSVFGIVILLVMGAMFNAEVEEFTGSIHDPEHPKAVGRACYLAAGIYALFLVFCGCQSCVHNVSKRRQTRF